jgi:hypothetical protein
MKKTLQQLNAEIAKRNALFAKMPKARKRVAIARDVLAQLGTKIVAITGQYLASDLRQLNAADQLQKHLVKIKTCKACALGAMFVCGVQIANDLTVRDSGLDSTGRLRGIDRTRSTANVYLRRFFSREQLALIESAYEVTDMTDEDNDVTLDEDSLSDALEFTSDIKGTGKYTPNGDALRLRLIMENIVANKGTFKPEIKPVAQYSVVTPGFKK